MTVLSKIFFIVGFASIAYGIARWQITSEIAAREEHYFSEYLQSQSQQFFAAHANDSSKPVEWIIPHGLRQLQMRAIMPAGLYPGWPEFIIPSALGFMALAVSFYFAQRNTKGIGVRESKESGSGSIS